MNTLSICNSALQRIGVPRIMAMDENSKEARVCNSEFEGCKKFVLRNYPWGFATQRVNLSPLVETPAFEFSYAFQLPTDYLRVVELFEYYDKYRCEGGKILANTNTLNLRYVANVNLAPHEEPLFEDLLAWHLAYTIARYLTESETVRQEALQGYQKALPMAKFVQSTEHSQQQMETDPLIDYGHSRFVRNPMTS
jgi:hypothetical protein